MISKQASAFLKSPPYTLSKEKIPLCTCNQLKGGVTYVGTRLHACVRVQSTWWEGLIIEAKIPVQKLEGQRGEGLIFGRIRYIIFHRAIY